jgi:hypothetical protein
MWSSPELARKVTLGEVALNATVLFIERSSEHPTWNRVTLSEGAPRLRGQVTGEGAGFNHDVVLCELERCRGRSSASRPTRH